MEHVQRPDDGAPGHRRKQLDAAQHIEFGEPPQDPHVKERRPETTPSQGDAQLHTSSIHRRLIHLFFYPPLWVIRIMVEGNRGERF